MSKAKKKEATQGGETAATKKLLKPKEEESSLSPPITKGESGKGDFFDSIFTEKKQKLKEAEASVNESKAKKKRRLEQSIPKSNGEKSVLESVFAKSSPKWIDDGLGGKFNHEGYTGRVEDGVKVFKAHVLNRPAAGSTKDCPFDCQCCFI